MAMMVNEYPAEIIERVLQINPRCDIVNETINDAFGWHGTLEGDNFWKNIYMGKLDIFYERYPDISRNECIVTIQKDQLYLHSYISPATAKMVVSKEQAKLLIEKLKEFVK